MDLMDKEKYQLSASPLNVVKKYSTIKLSSTLNFNSNFISKSLIWAIGSPSPWYVSKIGSTWIFGSQMLWISSYNGFESLEIGGLALTNQLLPPILDPLLLSNYHKAFSSN